MDAKYDYNAMLEESKLAVTKHRLKVLEVIGNSNCPLSTREIFETLNRTEKINRVTVYRIVDLLVDSHLVDRISGGKRSFYYEIAPNKNKLPHSHFYCRQCGSIECLGPESLQIDIDTLIRTFPGLLQKIEIRLDGICKNCLKKKKKPPK
jgi:Fur family ferric uptake transcriptional regulator